jgi:hypothetical protein
MTLVVQKPTGGKLLMRQTWAPADTDAAAYIAAVEAADGQALEERTRKAIDDFVLGCKADGIWTAIKASCILAGARTLSGALVPLVGGAPTNFNFVSGDYNRKTGLVGDGSTKYLDSNRANNADPQNNNHNAVYLSAIGSGLRSYMAPAEGYAVAGSNTLGNTGTNGLYGLSRSVGGGGIAAVGILAPGNMLLGIARSGSTDATARIARQSYPVTGTSSAPSSGNLWIYASGEPQKSGARLAFYSIGESLDLTLLDSRVTQLITTFAAVIP